MDAIGINVKKAWMQNQMKSYHSDFAYEEQIGERKSQIQRK